MHHLLTSLKSTRLHAPFLFSSGEIVATTPLFASRTLDTNSCLHLVSSTLFNTEQILFFHRFATLFSFIVSTILSGNLFLVPVILYSTFLSHLFHLQGRLSKCIAIQLITFITESTYFFLIQTLNAQLGINESESNVPSFSRTWVLPSWTMFGKDDIVFLIWIYYKKSFSYF